MAETLVILPSRETFSAEAAGGIALVVRRFALAVPGVVVVGAPCAAPFPGVAYQPARGFVQVLRAIWRLRPEVVEVHQNARWALSLAMLLPRTRVLLVLHNDPLTMRGLKTRIERRLALWRLHRVVCVSAYLQSRFMTGLPGAGAVVLHNPLSLSEMPPRAVERSKVVLFAGRITTDKGPDIFIAAWEAARGQLPGWSARMIGGDRFGLNSPATAFVVHVRKAAAASGVAFEGVRPHGEVLAAMARAAIVVVPSRWGEPFGLTALEAMASGAALITTGHGGLREVAGDAAVYFPSGDVAALAGAIVKLCTDDAARQAIAEAGLRRAVRFDTPALAAALVKLRGSREIPGEENLPCHIT